MIRGLTLFHGKPLATKFPFYPLSVHVGQKSRCLDTATDPSRKAVRHPAGFAALVTLEWPYSPAELIDCDPSTSAVSLSPLFESQVLELKNWSLQPHAIALYPVLAGHVKTAY